MRLFLYFVCFLSILGYGFLSENADFCTSIMQRQLMVNTPSKKNDKNDSCSSDAVSVAWLGKLRCFHISIAVYLLICHNEISHIT